MRSKIANVTAYGLTAVEWSRDVSTVHQTAAALRVGKLWLNVWGTPGPRLPWGGTKATGIGRELGLAGRHANT